MSQYENARNGTGKNSKHSQRTDTGDSNGNFLFTGQKEQIKRNPQTERGDNPENESQSQPQNGRKS